MKTPALASLFLLAAAAAFGQGALTPPGAPAPLFKTLAQIEPRIPLTSNFVTGDLNYHFIITNSGSYYLTSNLNNTLYGAIRVVASNVVLDLGGFLINRVSSGSGAGVTIEATADGIVVQNGTIRGMGSGTSASFGGGRFARGGRFSRVRVEAAGSGGLLGGEGWTIEQCTVNDSGGASGFTPIQTAGGGNLITDCTVRGNFTTGFQIQAISAGLGSVVRNCVVTSNNASGNFTGILVSGRSVVSHCVVQDNTSATLSMTGIYADGGGVLSHCVASGNRGSTNVAGFYVTDGAFLEHCNASANVSSNGYCRGITSTGVLQARHCLANGNRMDGAGDTVGIFGSPGSAISHCVASKNVSAGGNVRGILVDGSGSIVSCQTGDNTANLEAYGIQLNGNGAVSDCVAYGNAGTNAATLGLRGVGISGTTGALITRCQVGYNRGDGIRVSGSSVVRECSAIGNGYTTGDGAGIHAAGTDSRIEGNQATSNDRGFEASVSGNLFVRNTAANNSTNYFLVANNIVAPIIFGTLTTNSVIGLTGGAGLGTTDPAANLSY